MKNYLSPPINIVEVILYPMFCIGGEVMDIPECFYTDEVSYQFNNLCDIDEDINSFARPLVSSFYCHSSHFSGGGGYFEGSLEKFWEDTISNINSIREGDYKDLDTEEFTEYYGEEGVTAMKFIGEEYLGVVYDTKVERGRLSILMYIGDCSVGGDSNKNTSDSPGYFSKEDMPEVEYVSDLEELDRGEVPDCITKTSDLSLPVLQYSLGRYLVSECLEGDELYSENITETLYNKLVSRVDSEDLYWCELEGEEVVNKWVELVA